MRRRNAVNTFKYDPQSELTFIHFNNDVVKNTIQVLRSVMRWGVKLPEKSVTKAFGSTLLASPQL